MASLLSRGKRKIIVGALRGGFTRRDAATLAGISDRTLRAWIAQGERDEAAGLNNTRCARLAIDARRAEAACGMEMAHVLVRAARAGSWRAANAWLNRRQQSHPDWGD